MEESDREEFRLENVSVEFGKCFEGEMSEWTSTLMPTEN